MSAELHRPRRRRARHTYFVGRRSSEAPEVYAVTKDDVRRLRPDRHGGPLVLDWRAGDALTVELSHVLLTSVAGRHRPSPELKERFALDVLAALPEDGFVVKSDVILQWLREAREPGDSAQLEPRRSRLEWLRAGFHRKTNAPVADG